MLQTCIQLIIKQKIRVLILFLYSRFCGATVRLGASTVQILALEEAELALLKAYQYISYPVIMACDAADMREG